MTRDEILAMPAGRELDSQVAEKVMGLKQSPKNAEFFQYWPYAFEPARPYSTDIAAAWEVVGKFGLFNLTRYGDGTWGAQDNARFDEPVVAETAPLAICRASLLALLPEGEG